MWFQRVEATIIKLKRTIASCTQLYWKPKGEEDREAQALHRQVIES
jgi:hypothetical protein